MNKTSFIFERKENKNNKTVKWLDWMTISKDEEDVWRDSEKKKDLESNEVVLPSNILYEEEEEEEEPKETVLRSALKTIKRDRVSYNGTMESQFKATSKRVSHQTYDEKERNKWINDSNIEEITYLDLLCFYFTSLYNNKQYKFQFVEYIGEITMMYEQIDKRIKDLITKKEEYKYSEASDYDKLNFLFEEEKNDVVTRSFYRMDLFLKSHLKFMRLCSAPVDLFLEKYYSARNNSCGLITHINLENLIRENGCRKGNNIKEDKFFIEYDLCKDLNSKELFFDEMTSKIYKNSNNQYDTTVRRCAALHNMLGELSAISEFIKSTVDMNDQLLFRVMVLAGNFFVLIGEYVWNTRLKQHFD